MRTSIAKLTPLRIRLQETSTSGTGESQDKIPLGKGKASNAGSHRAKTSLGGRIQEQSNHRS